MLGKSTFSFFVTATLMLLAFVQEHFFLVSAVELNPTWYLCRVEFTDKDAKIKTIADCATKQKYKLPSDLTIESIQEEMKRLSSNDFDDSCFSKCWYESSNLIKDGKINTANFGGYFKTSNITEPLLKEYTKLFEECVKETEPKFKDEKEIPCKMFTMIDFCNFKKFQENKKRLEEVCNKA